MVSSRPIHAVASGIFVVAFICAGTQAGAQTIYRHVSLAGSVTYTDQADFTPPPAMEAAPDAEAAPEEEEAKPPPRRHYVPPRLAAAVNANEAERRLRQAQLKRKLGMAPLPGERMEGSGALNARYWHRQESLRRLVEQAQHRLNATHKPQLAAQRTPGLHLATTRAEEIPEDQSQHRQ